MKKIFSFTMALILYIVLYAFVISKSITREISFEPYWLYRKVILTGWLNTILISLVSILLALVIGLILYFMQQSKIKTFYYLAEIHKTIIFGTPLLVIAIISYYYIGFAFNVDSQFAIGCITLALYIGAYISDVYKGAIESIHVNQWQAAKMFGFSRYQTYRYIIFPQVFKSILPPLAGQFALTIKGSALLAYMSTRELLTAINTVQAASYRITEGFVVVTIGYWLITIPLILLVRRLEQKASIKV